MVASVALFEKILRAELEDLLEDFDHVEARYREEYGRLKIGQYVFMENSALLSKERDCIGELLACLREIDGPACDSVEEYARAVSRLVEGRVKEMEYPQAVLGYVNRKIDKVRAYVEHAE